MKKALFFLAMAMLTLTASAKPVDQTTAMRVASNFMRLQGVNAPLTDVTAQTPYTQFYIFTATDGGFVLVSGDDCVTPILGFSTTSIFVTDRIPSNVGGMLEQYDDEISYWRQQDGIQTNADWLPLLSGTLPEPVNPTAVSPLCSTSWGQDPYYNNLCPFDASENEHAVTGCVATATAQVMKKWNYPTTGYGSHSYYEDDFGTLSANFGTTTYQWSNMPTALTSTSSTTQVNAVATLMYHIGVADEMDYAVSSSGASNYNYFGYVQTASSESSLQYYFKYRSDMAAIARVDYSNAEYINLLKADLDAGRPILYSGRDYDGGHSFVLDGYNNSNQFHVNWGWRGYYDGYFTMGALNPDGGGTGANAGTYNLQNVALIKIQPNTSWSTSGTTTVTANATGGTGCSVTGAGTYSFGDTIRLQAVAATGYHFTGWSDGSKFNPREFIANGGTLSFTAQFEALGGDTITYCPGNRYLTSLGTNSGTSYWGIRLPAASVAGDTLTKVRFYATETGSHTLTIYSGTSSPTTTLQSSSFTVSSTGWNTVTLSSGVAAVAGQDLWITLSHSGGYPAAMSYSGGHNYGLLWGSNFSYANYSQCSWMIKGIFGNSGSTPPTPPVTDTCLITSFPYTENFDNSATYGCLRINNANGDTITWGLTNSYGYNSSICAYIRYAVQADDYLILPGIVTPGNYTVTWKAKAYNASYPETYQVYAGSNMIYSETLSSTSYVTRTATFTVSAGDTVNLMFRYISDDMYYFFLDDITITQGVQQYTITVTSANPTMGSVSGGGTFNAGATAYISATAYTGYHFTQWQDGNTTNPRSITVTGNATYTASFESDATPATTDTISWCGTTAHSGNINAGGSPFYWGISLTPTQLSGHNYLKSVMVYVRQGETYNLSIYSGGTSAPGTLVHSQTVTFTAADTLWQEILLNSTISINSSQNLWIILQSTLAAACSYVNNVNSDWVSTDGTTWSNLHTLGDNLQFSWLIKAVTSQTAPTLPAPTVTISGPNSFSTGTAQTFTANAPAGATITWSLTGATPATATGNSITATWSTPGTYNIIATATNSSGIGRDTLTVNVISCGNIVSFPYVLSFDATNISQLACWTVLDADNDGYSWTATDLPGTLTGAIGSASFINNVGALTPDNWLISPQIQFTSGSNYTLSWQVWAPDASWYAEHYGIYVSTSGTATSNFTLIQDYTLASADTTNMTLDLSAYAGQNIYLAFRHWNVTDQYWMMINHITITQTAIPGQNYTITVQSANPTMGSVNGGGTFPAGTAITISATANSGYHFTQWNDGNTNATRSITVTGNATYIANFESDAPNQYTITVLANNDDWGTVSGSGTYAAGSNVTISAVANSGYRFVQWNDGNTNATRTITVNANATYIATFEVSQSQQYTITVLSNNNAWGTVSGGGTYPAGSNITINAIPNSGYRFVQWNDGNTNAQRSITVTANATYTATFEPTNGIDGIDIDSWAIYPNPATTSVTISLNGLDSEAMIEIVDMNGRTINELRTQNTELTIDLSSMTKGAYFIRITSGSISAVRKLIVK